MFISAKPDSLSVVKVALEYPLTCFKVLFALACVAGGIVGLKRAQASCEASRGFGGEFFSTPPPQAFRGCAARCRSFAACLCVL